MSRKHYQEVAEILKAERRSITGARGQEVAVEALQNVATELALMFKRDNPRFQAGNFFDAAGFPELTATRQGLN